MQVSQTARIDITYRRFCFLTTVVPGYLDGVYISGSIYLQLQVEDPPSGGSAKRSSIWKDEFIFIYYVADY